MRNPFRRKPKPYVTVSALSLQARVDRILPIMRAMAEQASVEDPSIGKLAGSAKLQTQLDALGSLPDEQLAMLLDILEAGVPDEFKDQLR